MPTTASSSPDWLALDQQLCFALYSASHAMTRAYQPLLTPLGLTYPQYLVMLVLWEQDEPTVTQLGERLSLDSGTLTPLLKRLESAGHLRRERDPEDERRVRVHLTDHGRALRGLAVGIPPAVMAATGCGLDELRSLVQRLKTLRQLLKTSAGASHDAPVSLPHPAP